MPRVCVSAVNLCVSVCVGPTCVPDVRYQVLSPYWDLIWDTIGFFIDFGSLTHSMPTYHYKPHRANYYPYWVLTHPSTSIGSSLRVYCVCNTPAYLSWVARVYQTNTTGSYIRPSKD